MAICVNILDGTFPAKLVHLFLVKAVFNIFFISRENKNWHTKALQSTEALVLSDAGSGWHSKSVQAAAAAKMVPLALLEQAGAGAYAVGAVI